MAVNERNLEVSNIPAETISKAIQGDKKAVKDVLEAYEPYITEQATVDNGTSDEHIDKDLAQALRLTMLENIPKFSLDNLTKMQEKSTESMEES